MSATAEKSDPKLWEKVKKEVTTSDKGGKPGQWSARKAQLAVHEYKDQGGGYKGKKSADNHLAEWTGEHWGTKSGKPSGSTGERYLPQKARDALSPEDYARTTRKKRADTRKGVQHSAQPKDVADKTAPFRDHGHAEHRRHDSKAALYVEARARDIPGRSKMTRDQLMKALGMVASSDSRSKRRQSRQKALLVWTFRNAQRDDRPVGQGRCDVVGQAVVRP